MTGIERFDCAWGACWHARPAFARPAETLIRRSLDARRGSRSPIQVFTMAELRASLAAGERRSQSALTRGCCRDGTHRSSEPAMRILVWTPLELTYYITDHGHCGSTDFRRSRRPEGDGGAGAGESAEAPGRAAPSRRGPGHGRHRLRGQFPLIACLDRYGPVGVVEASQIIGVSQPAVTRVAALLEERGWLEQRSGGADSRLRSLDLSPAGREVAARMRSVLYPAVEAAARDLCARAGADFLDQLDRLERALAEVTLFDRVMQYLALENEIELVEYGPGMASHFYDINHEWIREMYRVEPSDLALMNDPEGQILRKGGCILFARSRLLGIIGVGALLDHGQGVYELSKMGVLRQARGRKAGERLIRALIERANHLGARCLFLLTNQKSAAAIHLYERNGFVHDHQVMERYGAAYERCNVAMRYDSRRDPHASAAP